MEKASAIEDVCYTKVSLYWLYGSQNFWSFSADLIVAKDKASFKISVKVGHVIDIDSE